MTYFKEMHTKAAEINPKVYQGYVGDNEPMSILDAAIERKIPKPLIDRVGIWGITMGGLECLVESYWIEKDRFFEDGPDYTWIDHMGDKGWVNKEEFIEAFNRAVSLLN